VTSGIDFAPLCQGLVANRSDPGFEDFGEMLLRSESGCGYARVGTLIGPVWLLLVVPALQSFFLQTHEQPEPAPKKARRQK
jgi:hypothetical protein